MKLAAVLIGLTLSLPLAAHADDASLHTKAQEVVLLLHTDRMVNQVAETVRTQIADAAEKVVGDSPTPEAKAKLADFEKKTSDMIDDQVGWKTMEAAFVDIYAKTFTEPELDGIIAFLKSPAGAAFLEKTPTVKTQATELAKTRLAAVQEKVIQSFEEFRNSQSPATSSPAPSADTPK